jgi:hypothetical protein
MHNFFSLVSFIFAASTKAVEVFTAEIAKDGKATALLVEVVKDVVPALESSGVKQTAKQLTDAGSVLDKTLSRMQQDVKMEFMAELPKSTDFVAISDRTDGAARNALAWVPKAELARSHGETVEELEESLAQEVKYLRDDVKYGLEDLERMAKSDKTDDELIASVKRVEKKVAKAKLELSRRFGIVL